MNLPFRKKHIVGNMFNVTPREFNYHHVSMIIAFTLLMAFGSRTRGGIISFP